MDKIPKDFMSIKDTYYAALRFLYKHILSLFQALEYFIISDSLLQYLLAKTPTTYLKNQTVLTHQFQTSQYTKPG